MAKFSAKSVLPTIALIVAILGSGCLFVVGYRVGFRNGSIDAWMSADWHRLLPLPTTWPKPNNPSR